MHNVELNALYKNKLGVKDTKGLTRDDLIRGLKMKYQWMKINYLMDSTVRKI